MHVLFRAREKHESITAGESGESYIHVVARSARNSSQLSIQIITDDLSTLDNTVLDVQRSLKLGAPSFMRNSILFVYFFI